MSNATRPSFITCAHCQEQSAVAGDGPIPTYCGATCRSVANKARAKANGRAAEWDRRRLARQTAAQEAREQARLANARPCPYCSAPMTNPRRVQCGAPACKLRFHSERQADFQNKHKAEHGVYYSRQYDKPKQIPITCAQCGAKAVVTKTTARYCSHACWYDAGYGVDRTPSPTRRSRARRRLERAAEGTAADIAWVVGKCTRCGEGFTRRRTGGTVQHCSKLCRRRDAVAKRRALEVGATVGSVSRWRVHERDGWTCHICGDPVDRNAVVPDLASPVLDHVIPLARGGAHSEANLKTAHFYCNSVKRDLVEGWSVIS